MAESRKEEARETVTWNPFKLRRALKVALETTTKANNLTRDALKCIEYWRAEVDRLSEELRIAKVTQVRDVAKPTGPFIN